MLKNYSYINAYIFYGTYTFNIVSVDIKAPELLYVNNFALWMSIILLLENKYFNIIYINKESIFIPICI